MTEKATAMRMRGSDPPNVNVRMMREEEARIHVAAVLAVMTTTKVEVRTRLKSVALPSLSVQVATPSVARLLRS